MANASETTITFIAPKPENPGMADSMALAGLEAGEQYTAPSLGFDKRIGMYRVRINGAEWHVRRDEVVYITFDGQKWAVYPVRDIPRDPSPLRGG